MQNSRPVCSTFEELYVWGAVGRYPEEELGPFCWTILASGIAVLEDSYWFAGTSLVAQTIKNLPAVQKTQLQSLGWEDPLEKGMAMATQSTTLAWKIPWMEEPGGLQSMGSLGVRQYWASSLSPVFLPGESHGQRGLAGYSPWDCKESDTTEQLSLHFTLLHWFAEHTSQM